MADEFGAISYPIVATPANPAEPVSDPALVKVGLFLASVLNAELNAAWGSVATNTQFVKTVSTNNPSDGTFNSRDLPALFVWRQSYVDDQLADDYLETITDLMAFWVPQDAEQAKRALRDPAFNGLQKGISRALNEGRDPSWVDACDDDPDAGEYGSALMTRCGFFRMPYVASGRREVVTIQTDDDQRARYPAASLIVKISEISSRDPSVRGVPSGNTITMTAGAFTLITQQPMVTS